MRGDARPDAEEDQAERQIADPAVVTHSMPMNRTKSRAANPMSSSSPMMAMAAPHATMIGMSGRG